MVKFYLVPGVRNRKMYLVPGDKVYQPECSYNVQLVNRLPAALEDCAKSVNRLPASKGLNKSSRHVARVI